MRLIGLTGGIAGGKSTAARILAGLGLPVLDTDEVVHQLLEPEGAAYRPVVEAFGPGILDEEGRIHRGRLGQVVFRDKEARRRLESIVHPLVAREVRRWIQERAREGHRWGVLEVPLLVEAGWDRWVDEVWVVDVAPEVQVQRLMKERGLSRDEALARIGAQISREERRARATRIIGNEGTVAELEERLREAWQELQR
ncbi:MAG: dephospho-CoA kinase [Bacillota bacterium]|nr:dephospho-CoA kinase [Bacillota bacterium]